MNFKFLIKKILRKYMIKLGLYDEQFSEFLSILNKHKNIEIKTVIDVGASNGCWSESVMKIYPKADYYLIEANNFHKEALIRFKTNHKNVDYIIAAAANYDGNIFFDNNDPLGGLASNKHNKGYIQVPSVTIDNTIIRNDLKGPFMIKLDTHGFEIPIFEGAKNTIKESNLIIIEVYNFKLTEDSLMFYEMCEYMLKNGFKVIGLIDRLYRPKDGILWQFDLIFVPISLYESKFIDNNY